MRLIDTSLPEVKILEPKVFPDKRGFFMETYRKDQFKSLGIDKDFVQHNHSASVKNTLRGLHYQLIQPQAKLVRVIQGKVFDVAVDIRLGSPNFGQWFGIELSAENRKMLYIPEGFAHGFLVLSDTAEFVYLCSDYYHPASEQGIHWQSSNISINWRIPVDITPIISEKDGKLPYLSDVPDIKLPKFIKE